MTHMTVNNENQHEQAGDYRSRPRWSAGKKTDAVLRLLRGEPLEELSRELQVEAHRLATWRDDFLAADRPRASMVRPSAPKPANTEQHSRSSTPMDKWHDQQCPVFRGTADHGRAANSAAS
jgi:transposase-like protein